MNYTETIDYIHSRPKFDRILGNDMLRKLLNNLGDPQKKLKCIHIGGTNGKGSTAAFLSSMLVHAGYRAGLFTSPFIEVFNERIQIDHINIPDAQLSDCATFVRDCMEENNTPVSEFAFILAVSFVYFKRMGCDVVILEVGMGGLLDATNVIEESLCSVLTLIGIDHTQYLGSTIEEIATTKCGIIKEYGTVITYPCQQPIVEQIIEHECQAKNAKFIVPDEPIITDTMFSYKQIDYSIGLGGEYQPYNAVMAIEVARYICSKGYLVDDEDIRFGISNAQWKARFEWVKDNLIIDGSHNIDGMRSLKASLQKIGKPIILVMAMMRDKAYEECINEIAPVAKMVVATEVTDMPRVVSADEIAKIAGMHTRTAVQKDSTSAVGLAIDMADDDGIVCVCGSLYLAGEIRKHLNYKKG